MPNRVTYQLHINLFLLDIYKYFYICSSEHCSAEHLSTLARADGNLHANFRRHTTCDISVACSAEHLFSSTRPRLKNLHAKTTYISFLFFCIKLIYQTQKHIWKIPDI